MNVRKNPLTVTASSVETARWDNENEGRCPACQQEGAENSQMQLAEIQTVPVYVCEHHHICMPVKE